MSPAFAARLARRELRAGKKRFAIWLRVVSREEGSVHGEVGLLRGKLGTNL